jgi:hypothetical protein
MKGWSNLEECCSLICSFLVKIIVPGPPCAAFFIRKVKQRTGGGKKVFPSTIYQVSSLQIWEAGKGVRLWHNAVARAEHDVVFHSPPFLRNPFNRGISRLIRGYQPPATGFNLPSLLYLLLGICTRQWNQLLLLLYSDMYRVFMPYSKLSHREWHTVSIPTGNKFLVTWKGTLAVLHFLESNHDT